ncbi:MAG: CusA/CzcA family heavy metal efflux RND transporter, partial [Planctomycetota bacterium]
EATKEVRRATMFGECIITIVYLPILTLTGVEGKMFVPMALTVITALIGAMIFSVTFVPAAVAIFLFGSVSEKENILIRFAKKLYKPLLEITLRIRFLVVFLSMLLFLLSLLIFAFWQSEFIPSLDEGDIALHAMRIPGTSLSQSTEMQKIVEKKILEIPEVECVFSKIGTAEIATDPMPPNVADTFVILKDRSQWGANTQSKEDILNAIAETLEQVPGNNYEYTQPIQMRFNELISGVRSDLAVKIFGDDLEKLLESGEDVAKILRKISGASDVKVEQISGLPVLIIQINRKKMAKYGLNISEVQNLIEIAVGGKESGQIFEGDRRFDLLVRIPDNIRKDIHQLKQLPIPIRNLNSDLQEVSIKNRDFSELSTHEIHFIPLSEIAQIDIVAGPNQISRENGKRRIVVTANIRSRDIGSFVQEAEEKIKNNLVLPSGYWTTWGGQFEQLLSATNRLKMVIPLALLLIFILLFTSFGTLTDALLVLTGVPLAMTGGIFFLWMREIPLSISAGVGFIALSGVAVLNGLVMITFIHKLQEDGVPLEEAIINGAMTRLRPVLMTALVAALGFVPMAIATGSGAEVQRPLATVVIGGILTSTFLTLFVLPALYRIFHRKETIRPPQ